MTANRQKKLASAPRARARRPGRPAATSLSGEQFIDVIIAAAAEVYTQNGYHGVTVERILKVAGISRPTFYRYFKDRYEVLDAVIAGVNDDLRNLIVAAVADANELESLLDRVVDAYFTWGERIGAMAGPIYQEIHDHASPASAHRGRLLQELLAVFTEQPRDGLRVTDEPLLYDAAIHIVEHLGHATFWPERLPTRERNRRKKIIVQALRGLLAPRQVST